MIMGSAPSQQNINRFSALDNDTTCCVLAMLPHSSVVNTRTTCKSFHNRELPKWFEVDKYIESYVLDKQDCEDYKIWIRQVRAKCRGRINLRIQTYYTRDPYQPGNYLPNYMISLSR